MVKIEDKVKINRSPRKGKIGIDATSLDTLLSLSNLYVKNGRDSQEKNENNEDMESL